MRQAKYLEDNQKNTNTQTNLNRIYQSSKQGEIGKPLISQQQLAYSTYDFKTSSKKNKSIILTKRKIVNQILQDQDNTQSNSSQYNLQQYKFNITRSLEQNLKSSIILHNLYQLKQFFQNQVEFRLLFRASDHNFSVFKFHQICDLQSHTLVLCKTKNNQIIGGYTPLMWFQDYDDNNTYFKTDKKNQTFLFSINKRQKYKLAKANKNRAICCFNKWGPTFGGGYDLLIGDHADLSYNSTSFFPRCYQTPPRKDINHKYFTGSRNNQFKVVQWQVFKVFIKQKKKVQPALTPQTAKSKQSFLAEIGNKIVQLFFQRKKQTNVKFQQKSNKN